MAKGDDIKTIPGPSFHWVKGQNVSPELAGRAKNLRQQNTPEERILWKHLRSNQLEGFHFRRQQVIKGYIVDFYCHATALVVELDGYVHGLQPEYDHERDQILSALGLRVLRFRDDQVRTSLEEILETIRSACQQPH